MNTGRENLVYLAKLAEQAERFDEMVNASVPNIRKRGKSRLGEEGEKRPIG